MIEFLTRPLPKLSQMSSLYLLPELETHINTFSAWALSSCVYTCKIRKLHSKAKITFGKPRKNPLCSFLA